MLSRCDMYAVCVQCLYVCCFEGFVVSSMIEGVAVQLVKIRNLTKSKFRICTLTYTLPPSQKCMHAVIYLH